MIKCPKCTKSFAYNKVYDLAFHLRVKHDVGSPPVCVFCGKKDFESRDDFYAHAQTCQKGDQTTGCSADEPQDNNASKQSIEVEMDPECTEPDDMKCPICRRQNFTSAYAFKVHLSSCKKLKYDNDVLGLDMISCPHCPRSFPHNKSRDYSFHVRSIHGDGEPVKPCEFCGKNDKWVSRQAYYSHRKWCKKKMAAKLWDIAADSRWIDGRMSWLLSF